MTKGEEVIFTADLDKLIAERDALLEALIQIMAIGSTSYPVEAQWFPNFNGIAFSQGSVVWEQAEAAIKKAKHD